MAIGDDRSPSTVTCNSCGCVMLLKNQFLFDHDPNDTDEDRVAMNHFQSMGFELGAEVSVYVCPRCGDIQALFYYPKKPTS